MCVKIAGIESVVNQGKPKYWDTINRQQPGRKEGEQVWRNYIIPYDNVLKVVKEAADILGYTDSDIEAIKYRRGELKVADSVRMDDGQRRYLRDTGGCNPHPADQPRAECVFHPCGKS